MRSPGTYRRTQEGSLPSKLDNFSHIREAEPTESDALLEKPFLSPIRLT
jgi:hypothetical protein